MALVDRMAYPRLLRAVAAHELAEVFTPTADKVAQAKASCSPPTAEQRLPRSRSRLPASRRYR
jgi:hypothetical protein